MIYANYKFEPYYLYKKFMAISQRKKIIKQMKFEVCSLCQYDCNDCAHGSLKSSHPNFQLTLEELRRFLFFTKKSNYHISVIHIHGPGEPLLWSCFNEGIELISKSQLIDKIIVTTNGINLDIINRSSWKYIYRVDISDYITDKNMIKNKHKIRILDKSKFRPLPKKEYYDSLPSKCMCNGPMFLKNKIFFYCGPPVFYAAELMGKNVFDFPDLYCDLGLNYMDGFNEKKAKYLELCKYCWANQNIKLVPTEHTFK